MDVREDVLNPQPPDEGDETESAVTGPNWLDLRLDLALEYDTVNKLHAFVEAAKDPDRPAGHLLVKGPSMADLMNLARGVANDMGAKHTVVSGSSPTTTHELGSVLTELDTGGVLIIEEIHRIPSESCELLGQAMKDHTMIVVLGKGVSAQPFRLDLPRFTLIGVTKYPGLMPRGLIEQFTVQVGLAYQSVRSVPRPEPRPIRSPWDAEQSACAWIRYMGFPDAEVTGGGGPDMGVDVAAFGAVAQVKAQMKPIGRPIVQQLFGIASHRKVQAVLFSLSGFTTEALEWADRAEVALFTFDLVGEPLPINDHAAEMLAGAFPESETEPSSDDRKTDPRNPSRISTRIGDDPVSSVEPTEDDNLSHPPEKGEQSIELQEAFDAVVRVLADAVNVGETLVDVNPGLEGLRLIQHALAVDGLVLTEARSFTALVGLETSDSWSSGHPDLVLGLAHRLSQQASMTGGIEDLTELYRRIGEVGRKADTGALDMFSAAVLRLIKAACRVDGIRSDKENQLLEELAEMRRAAND